jgi:hypothetical protein
MWRVALSIAAVTFDALLLSGALLALVGVLVTTPSIHPHTVVVGDPAVQRRAESEVLVMVIFIGAGAALNILAIAFGARLRFRRHSQPGEFAAEFS